VVGVFSPTGTLLAGVVAFPGYTGPVAVASGDVTGDGVPDIIAGVGSMPGKMQFFGDDATGNPVFSSGPTGPISVFSGRDLSLVSTFIPAPPNDLSSDGILVGTADAIGSGRADVLVAFVSRDRTGVSAFDGLTGTPLNYPPEFIDGGPPD
jgi:hypothetical protein